MTSLNAIPKLEALSPLVFRVLGCNPGSFTLQGTNTYLVGSGSEKLLIDTGERDNSDYTDALAEALKCNSAKITKIICTHWHADHVGGVKNVFDKVAKTPVPVFKYPRPEEPDDLDFAPSDGYQPLADEEQITIEGATLRKVLNLKPDRIYPGHGSIINDGSSKIEQYIQHRDMRESQILKALTSSSKAISAAEIVEMVYEGLIEGLKPAAASNVTHHLKKLVKDGKVTEVTPGIWTASKL